MRDRKPANGSADNREADEARALREELVKIPAFRKFAVGLMVKNRYMRCDNDVSDYQRGRRDALRSVATDFIFDTTGGKELLVEFYSEMTEHNIKGEESKS